MTDTEKELRRLKKLFEHVSPEKKQMAQGLMEDSAFMLIQLRELKKAIAANGWSDSYQNGNNQFGKKTSPEADSYLKLQKLYQSNSAQLLKLLPDENQNDAASELMSFINK